MWEEILEYAPSILQAASIAVTAVFAVLGLNAWRRQIIGKRRIEVAEAALTAAYKARDAMSFIRSPVVRVGEGTTRQRAEGEDQALSQSRDLEFVPLERMQKSHEDFVELEKARLLCEVHFGSEAAEPFAAILQARHNVSVAANMLVSFTARERELQAEFIRELRREILQGFGRPDEADKTAKMVGDAVEKKIEALCRRQLKA